MKLVVSRFNQTLKEYDFSSEVSPDLEKFSVFVGRSEDCHVILDDQQISRIHAEFAWEAGQWTLKKKSTLGDIKVNGNAIQEQAINQGDAVSIGSFVLTVGEMASVATGAEVPQEESLEDSPEVAAAPVEEAPSTEVSEGETKTLDFSTDEVDIEGDPSDLTPLDGEPDAGMDIDPLEGPEGFGEEAPADEETPEAEVQEDGFSSDESSIESFEEDSQQEYPMAEYEDEVSEEDEELGEGTQVFQGFANFELQMEGKFAPYDKYVLTQEETFIGRDKEKCQILLNDPEVSSVHCVVRKNNVTCTLEDLNSSNGTVLNGSRINQAELSNNDEFMVGDTSFTFNVSSKLLQSESERLMPVAENQEMEVEEVVEVGVDFSDKEEGSEVAEYEEGEDEAFGEATGAAQAAPQSLVDKFKALPPKKRMIYIAVVGLLVLLLTGEEEPPPTKAKGKKKKSLLLVDEGKKKDAKKGENTSKESLDAKLAKLSPEAREGLERRYQLGKTLFYEGKYRESLYELEAIFKVIENYKEARSIYNQAKEGLAQIEELERKRRKEIAAAERREKVKELVEKARVSVKDKQIELSKGLFAKILELDPENFDVPQLKLEIDAWEREKKRKALEEEQKKAERQRMVDALRPGKNFYLQEKWYQAVLKLEQFLKIKKMDEDLITEGKDMLNKAKENLKKQIDPVVGKARSLKEGQDLKGAYEAYSDVIKIDPSNEEALNEVNAISDTIENRAKKLYREAIISESLSLFDEAKEKFQEVQQTSPSDSVYYKKATNKLKEYIE